MVRIATSPANKLTQHRTSMGMSDKLHDSLLAKTLTDDSSRRKARQGVTTATMKSQGVTAATMKSQTKPSNQVPQAATKSAKVDSKQTRTYVESTKTHQSEGHGFFTVFNELLQETVIDIQQLWATNKQKKKTENNPDR